MVPASRRVAILLALLALAALAPAAAAPPSCDQVGTEGNDVMNGDATDEVFCALSGNDEIHGGGGSDVIVPGPGDDVVDGGPGADEVSFEGAAAGVTADLGAGTASGEGNDTLTSIEEVTGSAHRDVLRGSAAAETLSGLGATDLVFGVGGADALLGGEGEDYLEGAVEAAIDGGDGSDTCAPQGVSCLPPSPPDANDARGFLDASGIELSGAGDARSWMVRTFGRWTARRMWDHGFAFVYLDTFGADLFDYRIMIRSNGRGLRAALFRARHRRGGLEVWRQNRRSASVRLPLDRLRTDFGYLRWYAVTLSDRCSNWCLDRVPDQGAMIEPI